MAKLYLKEWREWAELTQEQAGERLGVSHATVQRREVSKRGLPSDQLQAIATAYGAPSVGDLFSMPPPKIPEAALVNTGKPSPRAGAAAKEQVRTGDDPDGAQEGYYMTPEETRLIQVYRSLSHIDKAAFEMMAEGFAGRAGPREEPARRPPPAAGKTGT